MKNMIFELVMTAFSFLLIGYASSLLKKSKLETTPTDLAAHYSRRGKKYIVLSVLSLLGVLYVAFSKQ